MRLSNSRCGQERFLWYTICFMKELKTQTGRHLLSYFFSRSRLHVQAFFGTLVQFFSFELFI